jgi:hypothetical protein
MAEGTEVVDRPDLLASFEEINELMGIDEIERLEAAYGATPAARKAMAHT